GARSRVCRERVRPLCSSRRRRDKRVAFSFFDKSEPAPQGSNLRARGPIDRKGPWSNSFEEGKSRLEGSVRGGGGNYKGNSCGGTVPRKKRKYPLGNGDLLLQINILDRVQKLDAFLDRL